MIDIYRTLLESATARLRRLQLQQGCSEARDGFSCLNNIEQSINDIVLTKLFIQELQRIITAFEAEQNTTKEGEEDVK